MSTMTLIIGESGTGKSTSLRNINPNDCLLIQAIKKPLPFKSSEWKRIEAGVSGNVFTSDKSDKIIWAMQKTVKKIIIIDDFQYVMANEFMRESDTKGYDKFATMARHAWDILNCASELADDVRVYFLSHSQTDDFGKTKFKTIGKMLDDKITIEGLFSIVLKSQVIDSEYKFKTKNNGNDTVKSPIGLFDDEAIDNDLAVIDAKICDYYDVKPAVIDEVQSN